jgi:hypothetical protein
LYKHRFYIEFNFPDFSCEDSSVNATDVGGFARASHKNKCIQNNLRFVRDADVVLNEADSPRWVIRLTETKKRENGQFVKWRDAGGPSYPNAQVRVARFPNPGRLFYLSAGDCLSIHRDILVPEGTITSAHTRLFAHTRR